MNMLTAINGFNTTRRAFSTNKGFTLIELAIVLVIVGLLVGIGSGMVGVLTTAIKVRETRDTLDANMQAVNSWAAGNNRLPGATAGFGNFSSIAKSRQDSWGRDFIYLYDTNLAPAAVTKDSICGRRSTALAVNTADPAATINNVAFVLISESDDANIQTTASDGAITVDRAATGTIFTDANNSDLVRWVTLDELRSKIGCQGAPLKIVNNELPYGYENSKYVARLQVDGGVAGTGYMWCVNGIPPGLIAGTAVSNTTNCSTAMPANCAALASDTNWVSALPPVFMTISSTPAAGSRGSYQIRVMAHDSNGSSLSENNCTEKNFVLTINPQ